MIGKLSAFELNSFHNSVPKTKSSFKADVYSVLVRKGTVVCQSHEYRSSHLGDSKADLDDEGNLVEFEALLAKRLPRGTSKYKGKFPLKIFSCNKIRHIAAHYPNND